MTCEQDSVTRLERALTVTHNTMVHKTTKTVAQKESPVKIEYKHAHTQ